MRFLRFSLFSLTLALSGCITPQPETDRTPARAPRATAARAAPASIETGFAALESEILVLVNKERRLHGLKPLVLNPRLDLAAKLHAQNMARYRKMAHDLPESPLPTLSHRAQHVAYYFATIAENIALGYPDAETVVMGWMKSPGHRQNILSREIVEIGTGVADSPSGRLYFCQVFGRQRMTI